MHKTGIVDLAVKDSSNLADRSGVPNLSAQAKSKCSKSSVSCIVSTLFVLPQSLMTSNVKNVVFQEGLSFKRDLTAFVVF